MADFLIRQGNCHPLFVFDVGFAIDLDRVAQVEPGVNSGRPPLQHRERASSPFAFRPPPRWIIQDLDRPPALAFPLGHSVEFVLYDFGAVSLSYAIPLPPSPAETLGLSIALRGHGGLAADARRRVSELVQRLEPAILRPRVSELVEDYVTFELTAVLGVADATAFCSEQREWIARVLRGETAELSPDEIADAARARLSFSRRDVTIVDWDSALILDPEPADLRAVLEFANVQLLELRHLDDQADQLLERSYQSLSRRSRWRAIVPAIMAEEHRSLSSLQVDSAILLERVTNALKFLGEEYLARLYRLAAGRLRLAEWDGVIIRKLATAEGIYQKRTDQSATRRMELLEWVIILLIALGVVLTLRG